MKITMFKVLMIFAESMVCALLLHAQEKAPANAEELARKLSNPIAGLISVPLQNNIDYDIGAFHGSKIYPQLTACYTHSA